MSNSNELLSTKGWLMSERCPVCGTVAPYGWKQTLKLLLKYWIFFFPLMFNPKILIVKV